MTQDKSIFWLVGLVMCVGILYILRDVLLPFVAGMAIAYFLDPVCDWLEEKGCSRTVATTIVTAVFFIGLVLAIAFIAPLIINSISQLVDKIPDYMAAINIKFQYIIAYIQPYFNDNDLNEITKKAASFSGNIINWIINAIGGLIGGIGAVANIVSLLLITPIVAFYLLRDWDLITKKIDGWLPLNHADVIRQQLLLLDQTLSGFVRGQSMVCLILGAFYAVGLLIVGLDFAILLGFATGIISFIPYFGMLIGFGVGMGLAIAQFDNMTAIALVIAVFAIGQILEGYILTPRMIGGRIGLHPVWIIFALLTGGALFGMLGIMLAVPMAAVIGVLIRFSIDRYLNSEIYKHKNNTNG